ncbi:MAG: permease [Verrucomicrobiae bacterium]|nr:permease [Verrucomicrobiae bacterium]
MDWIIKFFHETWTILLEMAPYLLLGFFLAGLLSVLIRQELIERWLGKKSFGSVVKASLFGVPLPLCSCGVIPVTSSLYRRGASKGATTSFLTSTPQTGIDSILATAGLIGPLFAWVRVGVALISGIIAGLLVDIFETKRKETTDFHYENEQAPATTLREKFRACFHYGFYTLPQDIGKSLVVGILLAGLLGALLPEDWGKSFLSNPWLTYLAVTLIAIPLYVCSTGSIPIAFALMTSGVSPGAALVFLIAGPATNVATLTTLYKILGRRTIAIYLSCIVGISWLSGWLLDFYGGAIVSEAVNHHHAESGSSWWQYASGIGLILIVSWALIYPRFIHLSSKQVMETHRKTKLKVTGMTCSHCANNVAKALGKVPGVKSASADAHLNLAWVEGESLDPTALAAAISEAGYEFNGVDES